MLQIPFLLHAFFFAVGFGWVASQKEIEFSKILLALMGGAALATAGLWAAAFHANDSFWNHLSLFSLSTVLGATLYLWFSSRELLTQKASGDSVYLLTLTLLYFVSPWQGIYRQVGWLAALPCAFVVAVSFREKPFKTGGRVGLLFWSMLVSLTIGFLQIWTSPDTYMPSSRLAMMSPRNWMQALLQSASLVGLALNLVPFFDWVRESLIGNPYAASHQVSSNAVSAKRRFYLTLFHAGPLLANVIFPFVSYEAMMTYALVWSPIVSGKLADAFGPAPRSEIDRKSVV